MRRAADALARRAVAAAGAGLCLLLGAAGGCDGAGVEQPLPFNHRIHVVDNGHECVDCHAGALDGARAGLPPTEKCNDCHSQDITLNPRAAPWVARIRAEFEKGTELPWQRLYRVSPVVYFSHRRHTKIAGLECATCHGDIGKSAEPPSRPIASTLSMDGCMDCHERMKAENDCSWCHR